ncbi:uncharacterized protein LOC111409704 [Olea europaea var. sylvestris]|uniref:uncharacterized protein LOC111409704 n=1 Tax=Olea europaea var. sylvestris TaxID=158386 RepID=UPI000C1CD871|nr:uncharacterized protein LOC111409704 [Olea europaea var. sylvestris]
MALEICETSNEKMGHILDTEVTVVSIADAREVEEGRVFRDKDVLKMSLSFFAIQILGSHRQVSSKVVSSTIKYKYKSSRTIYTPKDICSDMLNTYGVYLSYSKAWRSREQTLKMIRGDSVESFGKLPSFFYMLRQKNPGTITEIEVDSHSKFKYCFMALGASIQGWEHCILVIVVDGTYLNGKYRGTLLTACTQDANNSIFILAFGIGDNENDKSWRWFFNKMKKAYGNKEGMCFVSDRHPSIKNAIEHVYPGACHGICSYHLLQNLKSYYGKSGENITQAFNSAVCAYTLEEYDYNMSLLATMNENIISYLIVLQADVGTEKWSRIHMPTNRHKDDEHGTFTKLSSKYEKEIRKMSMDLRNLRKVFSVNNERSTFVVDIEQRTCTYMILQVDLLPCPHALAVIANTRRDPYDYCSYYYTRDAYLNAYQDSVYPVGNQEEWTVPEEVQQEIVLPPNQRKSCGRPTEKRKRSSREGRPTTKCGHCGGQGHNSRKCSNLAPLR